MLNLTVAQDGSGDYASISEAVLAVPYELEAEITIGPGVYREKLVCEKRRITLRGAGADATRLVWGDGGRLPHPDGRSTHTFRSYTAFFSGEQLTVEDMTIENDAGPGSAVGQAVAAYGQRTGRLPPGEAAGQSGHPVLRPAARKKEREKGRLPRPPHLCAPPRHRPVLPELRDRG